MLPSLLVAAAVTAPAAPVPRDTVPNPTGPAPRVLAVKADASGVVWVGATVYERRKVQQQVMVIENGKQVVKQQEVEINASNYVRKTLADFGGKFATADGTPLSAEEATKRVKDGAVLLITADNKPVDRAWLRAVSGDTVVMFAEGLAHAYFHFGQSPLPTTPAPRLAMFCADDNGAVRVPVNPNAPNTAGQVYYDDFGGGRVIMRGGFQQVEMGGVAAPAQPGGKPVGSDGKKALEDVRFDAYDVAGKLVPRTEALKRLKAGGLVLLAGDNRFPDPDHLAAFRDDTLVLVSNEFVFPPGLPNPYDMPMKPAADKPGNKPLPGAQLLPAVGVAAPAVKLQVVAPAVVGKPVQVQIEK